MSDPAAAALPASAQATRTALAAHGYVAGKGLSTVIHLALHLRRPLLLEGEPGVGKTEIAKVLAAMLQRPLIRLQCYEGLDMASAAYEWNYGAQLIHIRTAEATGQAKDGRALEDSLFSERYLLARPLLRAIEAAEQGPAPVLLIDELDRADEPFEAFLLEFLADMQLSIPELGTRSAAHNPPIIILTSNRTRDVHDAVRRRCLYHWIDYPTRDVERQILVKKVPDAAADLTDMVVDFVQTLRGMDLFKAPGIAESISWAQALTALDALAIDPETISDTLGVLLKYQDDIAKVQGSEAAQVLAKIQREQTALAANAARG